MRPQPVLERHVRPRWRRFTATTLSLWVALLPGLALAADGMADAEQRVMADRPIASSGHVERIRRLLDTPSRPLGRDLSGLFVDSDSARAARETQPSARLLSSLQSQGGGGSSHGGGWLALGITGTIVGLTGVLVGSYGDSDTCHSKNPPYFNGGKLVSACDNYSNVGVGLAIGGLGVIVIGIIGAIASSSHQSAGSGSTPMPSNSRSDRKSQPTVASAGQPTNTSGYGAARQAIDEIRSQNPGILPPAQMIGSNRRGATTLEIKNDTAYTLHVFLSGPQSEVLNLRSSDSQSLTILPGRYELAARIDAVNVRPFYGTQQFGGGTAYGESFYIVGR